MSTLVYHFNNSTGGGVFSVICNLLKYSRDIEIRNHVIFTINKKVNPDFKAPEMPGAESVQLFYYSPNWNFYYTCRQLAKSLPDDRAVIVAHDWLELGMASQLGLQNPVVQFLHGEYGYYYDLAKKHRAAVDIFACVSPVIADKLKMQLPAREQDIRYCRFPVPEVPPIKKQTSEKIRILFCVRDVADESKQFSLLPQIHSLLIQKNVPVQWTIIGAGSSEEFIKKQLGDDAIYHSFLTNDDVINEMRWNDILIHPSLVEGFPVVVVEGMKAGLVPLINDWNGATKELVEEGKTGFYAGAADVNSYSIKIVMLHNDRTLLEQLSKKAKEQAEKLFDPIENTQIIEGYYFDALQMNRKKNPKRVYGSRLDRKWIPNGVVMNLRNMKL